MTKNLLLNQQSTTFPVSCEQENTDKYSYTCKKATGVAILSVKEISLNYISSTVVLRMNHKACE